MRLSCCDAELRLNRRNTASKPEHTTKIERFGQPTGPDVLLLVGRQSNRQVFILAESILRQLGPRWESLLSKKSRIKPRGLFGISCCGWLSRTPRTLNLRDDQPDAVRVILLIATLQFAKVPRVLDFADVVRLADVAARYDAHSLLAGYMDGWLAPYRGRLLSPGYEGWLFIAQQFGYEAEYSELAKFLAMNCRADASGEELMVPKSSYTLKGRIPVDSLAQIRKGRRLILCNILRAAYDLWASMSRGINCKVARVDDHAALRSCAAMNLLLFTDFLRELGLFPMLRTVTDFRSSPKELAIKLSDVGAAMRIVETTSLQRRGSAPVEQAKHVRCHVGFQLKSIMSRILEDVSWPMGMPTLTGNKDDGGECKLDIPAAVHSQTSIVILQ